MYHCSEGPRLCNKVKHRIPQLLSKGLQTSTNPIPPFPHAIIMERGTKFVLFIFAVPTQLQCLTRRWDQLNKNTQSIASYLCNLFFILLVKCVSGKSCLIQNMLLIYIADFTGLPICFYLLFPLIYFLLNSEIVTWLSQQWENTLYFIFEQLQEQFSE